MCILGFLKNNKIIFVFMGVHEEKHRGVGQINVKKAQ